jgi:hypothetical protein
MSIDITTSQNKIFLFVGLFVNFDFDLMHIKYEIVFTLHDVATSPNMVLRNHFRLSAELFFHFDHVLNMKVCLHLDILWSLSRYQRRVKHYVLVF